MVIGCFKRLNDELTVDPSKIAERGTPSTTTTIQASKPPSGTGLVGIGGVLGAISGPALSVSFSDIVLEESALLCSLENWCIFLDVEARRISMSKLLLLPL